MKTVLRGGMATLVCATLVACSSSNGAGLVGGGAGGGAGGAGGGAGGGGAMADFTANESRVQFLGPQTVRQTGTINYVGKAKVATQDPGQGAPTGFLIGDVNMAANFDTEGLTGTATNFGGEINGQAVTLAGTLNTANVTGNTPNIVTQADIPVPIVGSITSGNLIGNMRGTLTESVNNQSSDFQLSMTGGFFGTNAEGAFGTAAMLVGDANAVGFGIVGGGSFYLDKQ